MVKLGLQSSLIKGKQIFPLKSILGWNIFYFSLIFGAKMGKLLGT